LLIPYIICKANKRKNGKLDAQKYYDFILTKHQDTMSTLLHQLIFNSATKFPHNIALRSKSDTVDYKSLMNEVTTIGHGFLNSGISEGDRIAVYLPKRFEAVISFFAASYAGIVFVPINPLLKPAQVAYILKDCNVQILISSDDRLRNLKDTLDNCHDLYLVIDVDNKAKNDEMSHYKLEQWQNIKTSKAIPAYARKEMDIIAILYTSGSTGGPKGVVLSHKNLILGAESVAQYLKNTVDDNLLAVLPFSFDYGLSQLTTAFYVGACVTLMDYLLPRDVINTIDKYKITGLAGVPTMWNQLANLEWEKGNSLRYISNSGGTLPSSTLSKLRALIPNTEIYLMYGLTEAFRSTYLDPKDINKKPSSIGKAIPNAEIFVVRNDGSICDVDEPGELVHCGPLVSLGYWNKPEKMAKTFKPAPSQQENTTECAIAVWSGDKVKRDKEGCLYFISREDEMIKTSSYRVSPTEIEDVVYASGLVTEAVAIGVSHPDIGQAIVLIATQANQVTKEDLLSACKQNLPTFMLPAHIEFVEEMPKNSNGKIDRISLASQFSDIFASG